MFVPPLCDMHQDFSWNCCVNCFKSRINFLACLRNSKTAVAVQQLLSLCINMCLHDRWANSFPNEVCCTVERSDRLKIVKSVITQTDILTYKSPEQKNLISFCFLTYPWAYTDCRTVQLKNKSSSLLLSPCHSLARSTWLMRASAKCKNTIL